MHKLTLATIFTLVYLAIGILATKTTADDEAPQPQINGRPVMLVMGKVVVYPEGVDEAPKDYEGSLGGSRPMALVTIDKKVVGEIYAARLDKSPAEEAKGMVESADGKKITLASRETKQRKGETIEVVTHKIDANSNFGSPWMFHSLYFPQGDACVTFKLIAGEEDFQKALPYFETMLFPTIKGEGE